MSLQTEIEYLVHVFPSRAFARRLAEGLDRSERAPFPVGTISFSPSGISIR